MHKFHSLWRYAFFSYQILQMSFSLIWSNHSLFNCLRQTHTLHITLKALIMHFRCTHPIQRNPNLFIYSTTLISIICHCTVPYWIKPCDVLHELILLALVQNYLLQFRHLFCIWFYLNYSLEFKLNSLNFKLLLTQLACSLKWWIFFFFLFCFIFNGDCALFMLRSC